MSADANRTVLLVDDEDVVIDLLSRAFARVKLPYAAVKTGQEAVALLSRQPFGALVCDKNLPDMSGVDVLREARRLQPFCACIMITGYTNTESVLEVLRLGAADYLEKPFPDLSLLIQRVESAMDHTRAELERRMLADAVAEMQAALQLQSAESFRQKTEREVLESVVDLRVEEACTAATKALEAAQAEARAQKELEHAVVQGLEGALEYLRAIRGDDAPLTTEVARGVLREVEKRVEDAAALLRKPGAE